MSECYISLKQMAEAKAEGVHKVTNFKVSPDIIKVDPEFNARPIDWDHVMGMVRASEAGTPLPPVRVRMVDGVPMMVDGHHTREALLYRIKNGMCDTGEKLDAIQFRGDDAECVALMLTSAQGLPLTPLQRGGRYEKLATEYGWSTSQIADRVGKSVQHVADMRILAGADPEVLGLVAAGKISAATAVKATRKHAEGAPRELRAAVEKAQGQGKEKATPKTMVSDRQEKRKWPEFGIRLEKDGSNVTVWISMERDGTLVEVPAISECSEFADNYLGPVGVAEKLEELKKPIGT